MPTFINYGATRFVILTRRHAIKLPRVRGSDGKLHFDTFLHGLLANMQERAFAKAGWPELCPVTFALPGGWLLVMPRCEPLAEGELSEAEYEAFTNRPDYRVPAEHKANSFGYLNGRLVAVDYGN